MHTFLFIIFVSWCSLHPSTVSTSCPPELLWKLVSRVTQHKNSSKTWLLLGHRARTLLYMRAEIWEHWKDVLRCVLSALFLPLGLLREMCFSALSLWLICLLPAVKHVHRASAFSHCFMHVCPDVEGFVCLVWVYFYLLQGLRDIF